MSWQPIGVWQEASRALSSPWVSFSNPFPQRAAFLLLIEGERGDARGCSPPVKVN